MKSTSVLSSPGRTLAGDPGRQAFLLLRTGPRERQPLTAHISMRPQPGAAPRQPSTGPTPRGTRLATRRCTFRRSITPSPAASR